MQMWVTTPRFLTVSLEAKIRPSRVSIWFNTMFLRVLGPRTITSVLSVFSDAQGSRRFETVNF